MRLSLVIRISATAGEQLSSSTRLRAPDTTVWSNGATRLPTSESVLRGLGCEPAFTQPVESDGEPAGSCMCSTVDFRPRNQIPLFVQRVFRV